jgi:hypothetical protein
MAADREQATKELDQIIPRKAFLMVFMTGAVSNRRAG